MDVLEEDGAFLLIRDPKAQEVKELSELMIAAGTDEHELLFDRWSSTPFYINNKSSLDELPEWRHWIVEFLPKVQMPLPDGNSDSDTFETMDPLFKVECQDGVVEVENNDHGKLITRLLDWAWPTCLKVLDENKKKQNEIENLRKEIASKDALLQQKDTHIAELEKRLDA